MSKVKYLAGSTSGQMTRPCKTAALYLLFACFFSNASCQSTRAGNETKSTGSYELLYSIPTRAKNFTTDKLQNIYLLTPDNEVIKYTPDGNEQFRYPNKTLGEATLIDATNPFHLLLFFPDYQTVLTLDRTMNLFGQFNLQQFGLFRVNAVGMAGDGRLWVYDEVNFRLKKIGPDGSTVVESNDLSLALGKAVRPNFLVEKGQLVYLNDPKTGIFVFDVFGQYQKMLPLKGLQEFQVFDDQLIYFHEGRLNTFHLKALLDQPIQLPVGVEDGDKVRVEKERLYLLGKEGLRVFKF